MQLVRPRPQPSMVEPNDKDSARNRQHEGHGKEDPWMSRHSPICWRSWSLTSKELVYVRMSTDGRQRKTCPY